MTIAVLQTTTFGSYGGIQTYNRLIARALNESERSAEARVLIATDLPSDLTAHSVSYERLHFEALGGRKSAFALRTLQLALQIKIDLMIVGHVNYAPLGMLAKRLQPKMRVGVVIHGKDVWLKLSASRRRALHKADFVMSVSRDTYDQASKVNGKPNGRCYILPNALQWNENESSAISCPLNVPSGTLLLSVCRLAENEGHKGVDTVIEALPGILEKVPDVQYVVIGEGTDLERHRKLASDLGLSDRVHFVGVVDDAMLRSYYEACTMFVLPSGQEGFGIVFLEAMRFRKAIVAARCGGTPEVVLDGTTGLLVDYGDPEKLAEAVVNLCRDTELRTRLGNAGYIRLQENFTFAHFKSRLDTILDQELLSGTLNFERPLESEIRIS